MDLLVRDSSTEERVFGSYRGRLPLLQKLPPNIFCQLMARVSPFLATEPLERVSLRFNRIDTARINAETLVKARYRLLAEPSCQQLLPFFKGRACINDLLNGLGNEHLYPLHGQQGAR